MDEQTTSYRPGVVDVVGTLLPGVLWIIVLLPIVQMIRLGLSDPSITPIGIAARVFYPQGGPAYGNITLGLIASIIVGKTIKTSGMNACERLTTLWGLLPKVISRSPRGSLRDYMFPYQWKHAGTDYLSVITARMSAYCACPVDRLPTAQPFTVCYRFLNQVSPQLWAHTQMREAESRMAGSLFLAFFVSAIAATCSQLAAPRPDALAWMVTSWAAVLALGYTFRRSRHREVDYVYIDTLIACSEVPEKPRREKETTK